MAWRIRMATFHRLETRVVERGRVYQKTLSAGTHLSYRDSQAPQENSYGEPGRGSESQNKPYAMSGEQCPHDSAEGEEAHRAYGCAAGLQSGCVSSATSTVQADA